jgi:hypothetical protein
MNRRTFLRRGLAVSTVPLLVARPALADHVQEPVSPLTELRLTLLEYTSPPTPPLADDGSAKVMFDKLRIEGNVRAAASPSEHFKADLKVWRLSDPTGARRILGWDAVWPHQNIPPHQRGYFNLTQSNEWHLDEHIGWWEVELTVIGDESGQTLRKAIRFERI